MPMWANGSRRGRRRVWYCKQLRICSANNILFFIKTSFGKYFLSILLPFWILWVCIFYGGKLEGKKLWSDHHCWELWILGFRTWIWIVYYSSIHHHSHCYWIPPTAMMEWVASVIWGRAKTGTAVSRYSWVLMEMRILKTNHYHKNIEGKQCCFQIRF